MRTGGQGGIEIKEGKQVGKSMDRVRGGRQ